MLPEIENLLRLQEADKAIRRLQDEIAELPKRVAAIEHKLADTKLQLEKAQAAVKADEAARRKHDTAIADLRGKISKYRDQSLDVKTNDQYKALLHEIQFAEKEIAATEDKILELMVNADARDKEVKAAQAELKEEAAEIEKEKVEARQRTAEDEKQLTEWRGKRDQMRAGVNEDLLRHYERVSKFRGSGISEVRDHKCMACRLCCVRRLITMSVPGSKPWCATPASVFYTSTRPTRCKLLSRNINARAAIIPRLMLLKPGTTVRSMPRLAKFSCA
jgi:predicted  nucleic acid-binding Zn-ribbon protein